jgi:translation initiation factor 3 subunit H
MEPAVTGVPTLTKVTISSLALMKIVQHGTRALPELCAGSLLGLDDGQGKLEVTDCFAYPSAGATGTAIDDEDENAAAQAESDVTEFREDMMRLLRDCNSDDFCVGWYRTVNMGDWCNATLIEQQFEHQDECDQGTGKAKSALLIYDPYQTDKGVLSVRALRLTDSFMEVMRVRSSPEARHAAASDAALSRFRMNDIFYEIPVEIDDSSTLARLALTDLRTSVGTSAVQQPFDVSEIGLDRLVLATDPYLEKNVAFAIEELDALQEEQQKGQQYQKQIVRQKQLQDKWLAQRKHENAMRAERGEEPLPLKDSSLPFFRVLKDNSKLGSLLVRKQIDVYCEQINDWSAQSFEKLFLVGAIQQQQQLQPTLSSSTAPGQSS